MRDSTKPSSALRGNVRTSRPAISSGTRRFDARLKAPLSTGVHAPAGPASSFWQASGGRRAASGTNEDNTRREQARAQGYLVFVAWMRVTRDASHHQQLEQGLLGV